MQETRTNGTVMPPELFMAEKMMKRLLSPEVESISVFQATPGNMTMAEYRAKYPNLTRKQLKRRIQHDKEHKA